MFYTSGIREGSELPADRLSEFAQQCQYAPIWSACRRRVSSVSPSDHSQLLRWLGD